MSSCMVAAAPMEVRTTKRTSSAKNCLSRKKACSYCSSQKRRCDMLYPSCSRCLKKGIDCVYSSSTSNPMALLMRRKNREERRSSSSSSSASTPDFDVNTLFDPGASWNDVYLPGDSFDSIFDFANNSDPATPSLSPPLLPPLEYSSLVGMGKPLLRNFSPIPEFIYYHHMSDLFVHISRIRQYPKIFLKTLSCPFIHVRLYQEGLPAVLSTTASICALHRFRAPNTEAEIDASIRQLIQSSILAAPSTTIAEKLALGQALFLLECILLFEGSNSQSSFGERLFQRLLPICDELVEYLKTLPNVNDNQSIDEYAFVESIKTLVVLCDLAQNGYYSIRGEPSSVLNTNFFTLSLTKATWNARNEIEWRLAKINDVTFQKYQMVTAVTDFLATNSYTDVCFDILLFYSICIGQDRFYKMSGFSVTELPDFVEYAEESRNPSVMSQCLL